MVASQNAPLKLNSSLNSFIPEENLLQATSLKAVLVWYDMVWCGMVLPKQLQITVAPSFLKLTLKGFECTERGVYHQPWNNNMPPSYIIILYYIILYYIRDWISHSHGTIPCCYWAFCWTIKFTRRRIRSGCLWPNNKAPLT